MENIILLPEDYDYFTLGATEGFSFFSFLGATREDQLDIDEFSPVWLWRTDWDVDYFLFEVRTLELTMICRRKRQFFYGELVYSYFGLATSLAKPIYKGVSLFCQSLLCFAVLILHVERYRFMILPELFFGVLLQDLVKPGKVVIIYFPFEYILAMGQRRKLMSFHTKKCIYVPPNVHKLSFIQCLRVIHI